MITRMIDIVDDQDGFMIEGSDLPVPGAEGIIPATNQFLSSLRASDVDAVLIKYDTHFRGEYPLSPESVPFPNIHCEYGTAGWELAIDISRINREIPVFHMMKNVFDMWGSNPTGVSVHDIAFNDIAEKNAYRSLFTIKTDVHSAQPGVPRDQWMKQNQVGPGTEVVIFGVASDFCVFDAMKGYLERGCNVVVLGDLTKGLGVDPERSPTGDIRDVCKRHFDSYLKSGQLKIMNSEDYLKSIHAPQNGQHRRHGRGFDA